MIKALQDSDALGAAHIHDDSFERGWSEQDIAGHIENDLALGAWVDDRLAGFILIRRVESQAEILTFAVDPSFRRQGVGHNLLKAGEDLVRAQNVRAIFLEVAEDNIAAIALYKRASYQAFGRRSAYYRRIGGRVAALNFSKTLISS